MICKDIMKKTKVGWFCEFEIEFRMNCWCLADEKISPCSEWRRPGQNVGLAI
jgi:hypothetical protein